MNTPAISSEVKLYARLCQCPNDPCILCGRWRERTIGLTETWLSGTEDWVCDDCAFGIDPDLAHFAYGHRVKPAKDRVFAFDHFGTCPECGHANSVLNVGKTHWFYCPRHGLRWCGGYNIIGSWEHETEADWCRNELQLQAMSEVEPYFPGPPSLLSRAVLGIRQLWGVVRLSRATTAVSHSSDDAIPF